MTKFIDGCLIIDENGGSLIMNQDQIEYTNSIGEEYSYNICDIRMIENNAHTILSSTVIEECIRSKISITFKVDGKTYVPCQVN